MTATVPPDSDADASPSPSVSERTPLIQNRAEASAEFEDPSCDGSHGMSARSRRRTTITICILAFVLMLGENMRPAARMQIYEDVICRRYYRDRQVNDSAALGSTCKVQAVQEELALIKGYELLISLLPTICCTIPYGKLSDHIGRRSVLLLNMVGRLLSELWSLGVCHWSHTFSIRLVCINRLIQFIGGGPAVTSSVARVIVADYAEESQRTQIFLFIDAAGMLSGIAGYVLAAAFMDMGHVWTTAVLAEAIWVTGIFICLLLPETMHLGRKTTDPARDECDLHDGRNLGAAGKPASNLKTRLRATASAAAAIVSVFAAKKQALLLLLIHSPYELAIDAFSAIGLIYFGKKFSIPFSTGSLILSLRMAITSILILAVLPAYTFFVSSPRFSLRWSVWKRDRVMSMFGFAGFALGYLLVGIASHVWVAVLGLASVALSSGCGSTTMSLLGSAVEPSEVSVAFPAAYMLSAIVSNGLAPVLSVLFSRGMALGWAWTGLPFLSVACVMAAVFVGTFFIAKECKNTDK